MKIRYIIVVLIIIVFEMVQKSDEIDFFKITNFKWETMYVFNPYSNPKDIQ